MDKAQAIKINNATTEPARPMLRLFAACPRSGSTLLMRIFAESPACVVGSRIISAGNADDIPTGGLPRPDFSLLKNPDRHRIFNETRRAGKGFLVCREELDNTRPHGNTLSTLLASPLMSILARTVVLIRDPIRVFDSWKAVGRGTIQEFIACYAGVFQMLYQAPSGTMMLLVYEHVIQNPQLAIKRVCNAWDVPYTESLLAFEKPFESSFVFATDYERDLYTNTNTTPDWFATARTSTGIMDLPPHGLLSNKEKDIIEERLGGLYLSCSREDVNGLREVLLDRTWFGFDLDDTLHEFRRAAVAATSAVFELICQEHGTPYSELRNAYSKVLAEQTANAFTDGKTSLYYRRQRLQAVLEILSLHVEPVAVDQYLDTYEATLTANLEPKPGARDLLVLAKNLGKNVVVITEGPQDAQMRTLRALGLDEHVDFIATTNRFGVSKTDGLFKKVLDHLEIPAVEMAYIGDSMERDMEPALALGIFSIHLDEVHNVCLGQIPPRINTLRKLEHILSEE